MQEQIIYLSEYMYMRCFGNSEEMQCTTSMWAAARRNRGKTAYVLSVQITIGAECPRYLWYIRDIAIQNEML